MGGDPESKKIRRGLGSAAYFIKTAMPYQVIISTKPKHIMLRTRDCLFAFLYSECRRLTLIKAFGVCDSAPYNIF